MNLLRYTGIAAGTIALAWLFTAAVVTEWRNTRVPSRLAHDIPLTPIARPAHTAPVVSLPTDRGERWATLGPLPTTTANTPTVPGLRFERIKRRIHGPGPLAAHVRARTSGSLAWIWEPLPEWEHPELPAAGPLAVYLVGAR